MLSEYLDTLSWEPETTGLVEAQLLDEHDEVLAEDSASLLRPATPAWHGQNLGRSNVVPVPFEPVTSDSGNTAAVWARSFRLGVNGLPESVIVDGEELLASAIVLHVRFNGETEKDLVGQMERLSAEPRQAVFESIRSSNSLTLAVRTAVHYDGTLRFDIELEPVEEVSLDELTLRIPLQTRWATLMAHNDTSTDFGQMSREGMGGSISQWFAEYPQGAMPFTYAFFLGTYDRGVQWFCPSDRGWSNLDEREKIALVQGDDNVTLVVRMVDKPVTLDQPLALNFGLTVLPTRPNQRGLEPIEAAFGKPSEIHTSPEELLMYKDYGVDVLSSYTTDYTNAMDSDQLFGQPWIYNAADQELLTDLVELIHQQGLKYKPYAGWGVRRNIPNFDTFGQEMLKEPLRDAGWGSYWHNPASRTFVDWWLGGAKWLAETCGFDGMYLDSTAIPELSANALYDMDWTDDQGNKHGTYPVWEAREFIERLYILFHHELGQDGVIDLHDADEPLYFINAFADITVSGERHLRKGNTIVETFSPETFASYYMTHQRGDMRRFIWWNWMDLPVKENEMQAMLLVHDVGMVTTANSLRAYGAQVGYGAETQPWARLRKLREHYADARFLAYWSDPPVAAITPNPENEEGLVLSSALSDATGRRALVVVSNLGTQPWVGSVSLNVAKLGVSAQASVVDAMFNCVKPYLPTSIPLEIPGQSYRLLLINDRLPLFDDTELDGLPLFDDTELDACQP